MSTLFCHNHFSKAVCNQQSWVQPFPLQMKREIQYSQEDDCTLVKYLPLFGGTLCLDLQCRTQHTLNSRALHLKKQHHEHVRCL